MQHSRKLAIVGFAAVITFTAARARQLAGPEGTFDLSWNTIDGGGATFSTGGPPGSQFQLGGTIGQADAGGLLSGGSFELAGGFWAATSTPIDTCPADINGDEIVNVDDLLAVIVTWGPCPPPPPSCPADLAPPPAGNGQVNVDDLLAVISAWGACP
jgi:hypothetical protein